MDDNNSNPLSQLALLRALQQASSGPAADELVKADPSQFHKTVSQAAEANPMIKANVTPYSAEEYSKFKTFLTPDQQSGYAVKPGAMTEAGKDELISVFSKQKGRGNDILKHAVDVGKVKQLDAFDINNKLPSLYGQEFNETSRYKFDPQYAPSDWDYEKLGKPDVIGMQLDNSPSKVLKRTGRQVASATMKNIAKAALPVAVAHAAVTSPTVDSFLGDLLIPGGLEQAGSTFDDKQMITERQALENYNNSPAAKDVNKDGMRTRLLRELAGKIEK